MGGVMANGVCIGHELSTFQLVRRLFEKQIKRVESTAYIYAHAGACVVDFWPDGHVVIALLNALCTITQ